MRNKLHSQDLDLGKSSSSSLEQLESTLMTMVCDGKLTCNYAVSVVKNKVIIELICQGNCPHYHKECAIPPRRCGKGSCCTERDTEAIQNL